MQAVYELLFPVALILAALTFILIMRYFSHQERMAAIARGLLPEGGGGTPVSIWFFRSGLMAMMGGLGLLIGLWLGLGRGAWLIGGFVPIGLGLGLVLCHWLIDWDAPATRERKNKAGEAKRHDPDPD